MSGVSVVRDAQGNSVVVIPDIIFKNKQNINWEEVQQYLNRFIGEIVSVAETEDIIYIGKNFPDEFARSKYTRNLKGARAKAKANAVQGIQELVKIASEKKFQENYKEKHSSDAANGWYYYKTRFALPIYSNDSKRNEYNVYSGCLVINCNSEGKMYLYDLVNIKKEASNPLKTIR